MPASQLAASSSIVAGQPSLSLVIPDDHMERSTILLLPSSPLPNHSWDAQDDLESVEGSDGSAISSPPTTPGLSWDSHPGWGDASDTFPKSVFEDWDDAPVPNPSVIVEEDGVQTVLITPDSPFYQPPPSPPPFEFAPFSTEFFPNVSLQLAIQDGIDQSEPSADVPLTLVTAQVSDGIRPPKGQRLFLDTATISSLGNEDRNSFTLSPSLYHSPMVADEVSSWAPKGYMYGPDVPQDPLECIYSAGDVSPVDRWDTEERLWSPILLTPLRTAPCS